MKKTLFHFFLALLSLPCLVPAQEALRPLTANPRYAASHDRPPADRRQTARVQNGSLQLPFIDDFYYASQYAYPDMDLWSDSLAYVNTGFPIDPPSIGVATFDGLDQNGYPYTPNNTNLNASDSADKLTSRPINLLVSGTKTLQPSDSLALIFYYQPRGYGDKPEITDSLIVDFFNADSSRWMQVWSVPGLQKASDFDSTFQRGFIRITDPIFFRQDFRFRFRNLATTAGDFDHWHVDYVYLDKNVSRDDTLFDDVAFAYVPTPLLTRYSAMPYNQYNANEMTTGMRTWIRNNGGITSSLSYDHNVYQVNSGTLTAVGTYTGGADNLLPFHTGGYSQDPNHNGFSPKSQYTLAVPTTDSADYLVKHYITRTGSGFTEFIRENDTVYQFQRFRNYFAYDDGGAEAGYYVNGAGGRIAIEFHVNKTDTLQGARIYFDPVGSISASKSYGFRLMVWKGGTAGPTVLRDSLPTIYTPKYFEVGNREMAEFRLDSPIVLSAGVYYLGIQQQANSVVIGFDRNYDSHQRVWFTFGSNWFPSSLPGSLMFRPVMGRRLPPPVGVTKQEEIRLGLYSNPAHDAFTIDAQNDFSFTVTSLLGQSMAHGTGAGRMQVSSAGWPAGIYLVSVTAGGRRPQIRKLIIAR